MSRFPRRLIDELGDGHARRLLDSARSDEPPGRLVNAAIVAASKSALAASSGKPALRALARSRSVLAAATVLAGGMVVLFGAGEFRGGSSEGDPDVSARPATTIENRAMVAAPTPIAESVATTSVADLPDAPSVVMLPVAAPVAASAPPARVKSVTISGDEAVERTADLLREANRLRAQGRWPEAGATYRRVVDLSPESAEAYPAEVALANLELQQGRFAAALAHYEHVLASRPAGILSEEARWGTARALRAAGRVSEERAALEEFRARHPESPLVPAATQRLAEIGL